MAGRPGLIGVSVLVLAEEEHLQGFDLVLLKVGVVPAKDQAWRTKTATLKSARVSKTLWRVGPSQCKIQAILFRTYIEA